MTTKTTYQKRTNLYNTDTKYEFIIKDRNRGVRKPKGIDWTPLTKKEAITDG